MKELKRSWDGLDGTEREFYVSAALSVTAAHVYQEQVCTTATVIGLRLTMALNRVEC